MSHALKQLRTYLAVRRKLIFGAVLACAFAFCVRGRLIDLFDRHGWLLLQIVALFFICTLVGNLTLANLMQPATAAAIFSGVLGYAFGAGSTRGAARGKAGDSGEDRPPKAP